MQMSFHRAFCDPKLSRDNFICEPLRYQPGYFRFPSRQLMHSTLPIKLARNERAPKSGALYANAHIAHRAHPTERNWLGFFGLSPGTY
jgi:hypothetical protein